jgi:hypothetical protein
MVEPLIVLQNALRLVVTAALLFGLWRGLARTTLGAARRRTLWLAASAVYVAWLLVVEWFALRGALARLPGVPAAIFLPLLVGLPILLRSKLVGRVLDATPWPWLVGVQVYRVFGGVFLVAWAAGQAPTIFALPAGIGDFLTGLLALPVAFSGGRGRAVAWNLFGLLDLLNAITLGFLTAPGPTQLIVPDAPSIVANYPLVLIPAFAVPSSILLHALSLRQLRRRANSVPSVPDSAPRAARSATNAVADVARLGSVNHPHDLQLDA